MNLVAAKPNRLKIDKALVEPIDRSPIHQYLVRSIVEIGENLSIASVAEGVERLDQLETLRNVGCDFAQGHLFAEPMSKAALIEFMRNETWREKASRAA